MKFFSPKYRKYNVVLQHNLGRVSTIRILYFFIKGVGNIDPWKQALILSSFGEDGRERLLKKKRK